MSLCRVYVYLRISECVYLCSMYMHTSLCVHLCVSLCISECVCLCSMYMHRLCVCICVWGCVGISVSCSALQNSGKARGLALSCDGLNGPLRTVLES